MSSLHFPSGTWEPSVRRQLFLPAVAAALLLIAGHALAQAGAVLGVAPTEAAIGATLRIAVTDASPGARYELWVDGPQGARLGTEVADGNGDFDVELPLQDTVPPGAYRLQLRSGATVIADAPLKVMPKLAVDRLGTGPATAGRYLGLRVADVALQGLLTVSHQGRTLHGPVQVRPPGVDLEVLVPGDISRVLPADLAFDVQLKAGGGVAQAGSVLVSVDALPGGPFLTLLDAKVSQPTVRSNGAFSVTGQIAVDGGPPPAGMQFTAWWVGNSGQVLPLGGPPLQMQPDGRFAMDTYAPSLGSMSFADASGPGHIRLVGSRQSPYGVGSETVIVEGPDLGIGLDLDADVDINVHVRALRADGSVEGDLEGAVVRLSGGAPLVDPNTQPASMHAVGLFQAHQLSSHLQIEINQPGCEPTLNQLETDASGDVEFVIEQVSTISGLQSTQLPAMAVVGTDCYDVPTNPGQTKRVCPGGDPNIVEYTVEVRTRHLGYGSSDSVTGGEIPQLFAVTYRKHDDSFTIRNLRTGVVSNQTTSANIFVDARRTLLGDELIIGSPTVPGLRPAQGGTVVGAFQRPVNFIRLIDFGRATATLDFPFPAQRSMEFSHVPDVDGGITEASLFIEGTKVGDFTPMGAVGYCPGVGQVQGVTWKLPFPQWLNDALRRPGARWPNQDKACGSIEARNSDGSRTGSRRVCFHWAEPPSFLKRPGQYTVSEVAYPGYQAIIEGVNPLGAEQHSEMPDPGYEIGDRPNHARRTYSLFQTYDDGTLHNDLSNIETDHVQFARNPSSSAEPQADAAVGGSFGDQGWDTLLDQTFPLFKWYWGVPEIFGAEVFADLRVKAEKLFGGKFDVDRAIREMIAKVRFQVFVTIGVDIDVLFGLLVDAGASITGMLGSEMGVEMRNGQVDDSRSGLFFQWGLWFSGWVEIGCPIDFPLDPTCWIPDIERTFEIASGSEQVGGASSARKNYGGNLPNPEDVRGPLTAAEKQLLFRHPALAYDHNGRGVSLALDADNRLVATHLQGATVLHAQVLSDGLGIRNTAVAFVTPGHALAVWVESVLDDATFASLSNDAGLLEKAAGQRLHYAVYDGSTWGDKQVAWSTPGGDAHPAIAVCKALLCSLGGRARVVFSHRHAGALNAADIRTWSASYSPAGGMSPPQQVDGSVTPRMEVSPTVAFDGSTPVVAWVRYGVQDIEAVATRQLAYRHFSSTATHVVSDLPTGIATPKLAAHGGRLALAFTRADAATGFVGTRHALHYAESDCTGDACSWQWARLQDAHGRAIYGQHPNVLFDASGDPLVTLRANGFGAGNDGQHVVEGDPLGTATQSGDLVSLRVNLGEGRFMQQAITNDAASHFHSAVAINPLSGSLVAISSQLPQDGLQAMGDTWRSVLGQKAGRSEPLALLADETVALNAIPVLPDPALVALHYEEDRFVPGTDATVKLVVANHGAAMSAAAPGASIQLRFGAPTGDGSPDAEIALPVLAPAERQSLEVIVPVPPGLDPDQGQTLFATLLADTGMEQSDGGNDAAHLHLGDLPVPGVLRSETHGGTPFVRIGWDPVNDPRVVGYRIYAEDVPGVVAPLGASDVPGFLDLSAQYGSERTYYVSSYTASGTESARSVAVTVQPPAAPVDAHIFRDGLEEQQ